MSGGAASSEATEAPGAEGGAPPARPPATLYRDGGLSIVWAPPPVARDASAAPPDVSRVPGARVVADEAFVGDGLVARAGCARAASDRFAKGLEDVLFDRATGFALRAEKLSAIEIAVTGASGKIDDGLVGEDVAGKSERGAFRVRHVLTFAGPDRDVVVCTALCLDEGAPARCKSIVESLRAEGTHAPPPPPSLLTRSIFFAADHPLASGALLAAAFAIAGAWFVARRPRRRARVV
jgi:hypothetical protein